jgi:hypothetical protein
MSTKLYVGNYQATLEGCEASRLRDLRKELGLTNDWIIGKIREQIAKLDHPVTADELMRLVYDGLTPEEQELWRPEPHFLLYFAAYKGPISDLVGNGELVRLSELLNHQHPLVVSDKASLEDRLGSLSKHLTPKRQLRKKFEKGVKLFEELKAKVLKLQKA